MLEKHIAKLKFSSPRDEKIEATKIPFEGLAAYLYYDYEKQLHLIIKSDEIVSENRRGIKVKNSILDIIGHGKDSFIDIICTKDDFKSEFVQIIEQIIEGFNHHNNLSKSIKITINKWYYFFEKENNIELNESEVKGIIGELIFILNFSEKTDYSTLINSWKGPESGLRDFNFTNFDVEVKTSAKEIGHVHTISGQFQLSLNKIPLFIYSVCLKKSESNNSITIKKIIEKIIIEIGDTPFLLNDFFKKLEKINILATDVAKYNQFSYELKNILSVKIDLENLESFLLKNENTRISNIKYDYDFNGITNTEITFNENTI